MLLRTRLVAVIIFTLCCAYSSLAATQPREQSFDTAWRFTRGDIANAEQAAFDDAAWKAVDVPHDWSIAGPFEQNAPAGGAGAFLPSGIAWYRKHFNLDETGKGRRVFIEFDGVMDK